MTVIVGYLPTPEGEAAILEAEEQASRFGDDLVLVNSAHGGAYVDSALAQPAALEALVADIEGRGAVNVKVYQRTDAQDPTEEILDLVESTQARLLVIGLRRRSPVGKLFLGSTAQALLLKAPCPVLAVKAHSGNR